MLASILRVHSPTSLADIWILAIIARVHSPTSLADIRILASVVRAHPGHEHEDEQEEQDTGATTAGKITQCPTGLAQM